MTHPFTLKAGGGQAFALGSLGHLEESLGLFSQVLTIQREVLEVGDPIMTTTIDNYAGCLVKNNEYKKAEVLFQEVYQTRKRLLGKNHPSTLGAMHHLAWVAQRQNQLEKAIDLYRRVLTLRKIVLGPYHLRTIETLSNLAEALGEQGDHAVAVQLLAPVYEHAMMELKDHPVILKLAHNYGYSLMMNELYEMANLVLRETLEKKMALHGKGDVLTLRTWFSLVENYLRANQIIQAQTEFDAMVEAGDEHLGPGHGEVNRYRKAWSQWNR